MPRKDREKQNEYQRTFYAKNKEKAKGWIKLNQKKLKLRNREYVKEYLKTHPCVDCGLTDIRCLDFDHVRGVKLKALSKLSATSYSLNTIKAEIEKCEVRCANCHRIKTHYA